jgi:hypothetical protein
LVRRVGGSRNIRIDIGPHRCPHRIIGERQIELPALTVAIDLQTKPATRSIHQGLRHRRQ